VLKEPALRCTRVINKPRAGLDDAISALGNGLTAAGSNINLRAILHSIVALEQGSFHRAANVIGTNQSVVSRRIRALEDEFGVSNRPDEVGGQIEDRGEAVPRRRDWRSNVPRRRAG